MANNSSHFEISSEDEALLLNAIKKAEAVLMLGAGASATSTVPPDNHTVLLGDKLAELLAKEGGFPYGGERLPVVLGAVLGQKISQVQFERILTAEYTKVTPSVELSQLFEYTWRRLYTWNIDDAVENVRGGVQRRRSFNGLSDKAIDYEGLEYLHVVHLHGEAIKPGSGFIFSEAEYNARLNKDSHDWYREAVRDYVGYIPIFIGSRLAEPILSAELDRARPYKDAGLGAAFLIAPDDFTAIEIAGLRARNVTVLKGYLSDFVAWLRTKTGKVTPIEVAERVSEFARELTSRVTVSEYDVRTAGTIALHKHEDEKREAVLDDVKRNQVARRFLEGAPPTWRIAATDIPVWLDSTTTLYAEFLKTITARDRVFIIHGQSGSGKTTATLQMMQRYLRENSGSVIYELKPNTPSLLAALKLLERLHPEQHTIIYAGDAFVWGDSLAEDILSIPSGRQTIILSARSGEWSRHTKRRIGEFARDFQFQRFVEADYKPLIERLIEYVPAPAFKKLSSEKRIEKLRSSRSQLLMALRETTESDNFTNVITNEFQKLPDRDSQLLLLLAAVPTIARTGLSEPMAREAYGKLSPNRNFNDALVALDGIVSRTAGGRFIARHELYVRHIVENVAELDDVVSASVELLKTFTKYKLPIVKTVEREDAVLFKFLLNHNFNWELGARQGRQRSLLRIYSSFEVDFQLEGHYWLQYGQFLVMLEDYEGALAVLKKSIAAYPNNPYAVHAYADVQLRVAFRRAEYDAITIELIGDAVEALEAQHTKQIAEFDQYPMVTLADRHVGALIKHGKIEEAKTVAARYFRELEKHDRRGNEQASRARERILHFLKLDRWQHSSSSP